MSAELFFGNSAALIAATVFLILFTFLGAFDGLYFHIYKFKLHRLPEARFEHQIHAARGVLFVPIAGLLFAVNSAGWLLWLGLFLLAADLFLEIVDVLAEKEARALIGGIYPVESALHITATAARAVAIALVLSQKPSGAWGFSAPLFLDPYPPFLAWVGTAFTIGTGLGTVGQLVSMWVAYYLRSDKGRGISNEGNPVEEYDILKVYLSLPIALALEWVLRRIRPTIREKVVGQLPPPKAILYSYHRDAMLTLTTKTLTSLPGAGYIGYHGIASYFPTLHYSLSGVRALRFKKYAPESPKSQIIRKLNDWDGLALIRTDSGKPYGRVRASLIDLATATGRPLVPVSQWADGYVTIAEHTVPLRNACVTTAFGEPISPEELKGLDREAARELLQNRLDTLSENASASRSQVSP